MPEMLGSSSEPDGCGAVSAELLPSTTACYRPYNETNCAGYSPKVGCPIERRLERSRPSAMPTQRYSVTQPPMETLFTWIKSGEVAIPEIQRPFVWDVTTVRSFLNSLIQSFRFGFLIAWKNPNVKLKDGTSSSAKLILMDSQQRVTAIMTPLSRTNERGSLVAFD